MERNLILNMKLVQICMNIQNEIKFENGINELDYLFKMYFYLQLYKN